MRSKGESHFFLGGREVLGKGPHVNSPRPQTMGMRPCAPDQARCPLAPLHPEPPLPGAHLVICPPLPPPRAHLVILPPALPPSHTRRPLTW